MTRMKSTILLVPALLTCLCLRLPTHAQLLSRPDGEDQRPIIRAVLEAELLRQSQVFEEVRQLSSENIGLIPALEISGRTVVVLDAARIRELVKDGSSITYLLFKSFEAEGGAVVVRLSRVSELDGCFGGYHKESWDYIYVARKVNERWQAELKRRSSPLFWRRSRG